MSYRKGLNGKTGESTTRLYSIWNNIRVRCRPKLKDKYPNYAGRGIKVCEEWDNSYLAFKTWAIKNGWDNTHKRGVMTIERLDNNGDYTPDNCVIANAKQQARNRRSNTYYTIDGKRYMFCELADKYQLPSNVLSMRLARLKSKKDLKKLLQKPIRNYNKRSKPCA